MDVSFISVTKVLPAIVPLATPGADFLILIKPQFELEKRDVGKGGIVRDPALQERPSSRCELGGGSAGLEIVGVRPSRSQARKEIRSFFFTRAGRVD